MVAELGRMTQATMTLLEGIRMATRKTSPESHEAWFRFLSFGEDCQGKGTVLVDGDKMVLEITEDQDFVPHTIRGRKCQHWFKGQSLMADDSPVTAKWALVGDMYVGIWIEDGIEFLFSFQIPED
jgi:hypothetical protein